MESEVPYVSCWMALDDMSEVLEQLQVIERKMELSTCFLIQRAKVE